MSLLLATGCGGGSGSGPTNTVPIADAGIGQNVSTSTLVTLDGSLSNDADAGDLLSYNWHFVSTPPGSSATLTGADTVAPTFTPDLDGTYVIALIVSDGTDNSLPANVSVTASTANSVPVANAGTDQNVETGTLVTLDGSLSSDADAGDLLSYSWSFISVPLGSSAVLSNADTAAPTFTPDLDGDYVVSLTVDDGTDTSSPSLVTVTATTANAVPVANSGTDQNVETGTLVTLDGSASSDANAGDVLSYSWSFVSIPLGSSASLSGADTAAPTFTADLDGSYVISLTVDDGTDSSAPDQVTVTATTSNAVPVANAGTDQNVDTGALVTLDGSGSSDANVGDVLSYSWSFVSVPLGSSAVLSGATTVSPTFTADLDGSYVISLTVDDGTDSSSPDQVTVMATTPNSVPVADAGTDQIIETGNLVTLDGSASSDADSGDVLSYSWSFVSVPLGSSATLAGTTTATPTFTPDLEGSYVISLTVNDGTDNSSPDQVTITAFDSYHVGYDMEFSGASAHGANYLLGFKITVSSPCTLTDIGLIAKSAVANVKMALYTDNGGAPDQLVVGTASAAVTLGVQEMEVTPTALIAGSYWIMAVYDVNASIGEDVGGLSTTVYYKSMPFASSFPASFGSGATYTDNVFNYYLVVH